jgi:hypothetical protein
MLQEVMNMRRTLSLSVALLLTGGLAAPAFAQPTPQVIISHEMTNDDLNIAELAAFDQVANANPRMARRLAANPRLVNSDSFLNRWPELKNFFDKYPGSKDRFLDDPGNYLADVHMHSGRLVSAARKKKASPETKSEAAPAEAAPPSAASPTAPVEEPAPPAAPVPPRPAPLSTP